MYHGLKFDREGVCVEIPGQDRVPAKAKVRAFPVVERDNWIWVWMGDPERADPSAIPPLPWLRAGDWPYRPGYLHYRAGSGLINDNLLDFSHLSYVHEGTFGGAEAIATTPPEISLLPNGVHVERRVLNTPQPPQSRRFASFTGNVDRWYRYDFLVPGILVLKVAMEPAGESMPGRQTLRQFSCQAVTPETEVSSHYFFMITRDFRKEDPALTEHIFDGILVGFEEDRRMIEAQQARLLQTPSHEPIAIAADAGLIQFRRVMARLMEAENTPASTLSR
jgi:vanillate O-demethylase monooxygenase subunit